MKYSMKLSRLQIETAKQTKNLIQMQYQLADKQYKVIEGQHEVLKKQQETGERSRATETVILVGAFVLAPRFTIFGTRLIDTRL